MPDSRIPDGTPDEVAERAAAPPRVPEFDPTLGIDLVPPAGQGTPSHRLVAIGDSLLQGFQSGAIYRTDLSVPAIVAHELGPHELGTAFRYPRFGGPGGLPLNVELLLRRIEERHGRSLEPWELPVAAFTARGFMDEVEDYWERGPGAVPPVTGFQHNLSCFGWDLRDALEKTAALCEAAIETPHDQPLAQIVENNGERAALRVYPNGDERQRAMTLFDVAAALGADHDDGDDAGIETLVVFLGANNALRTVTELRVAWSGDDFRDLDAKRAYTIWQPTHFDAEFAEVVARLRGIEARHVILCTVPHVTIAPIARGLGPKDGSRYFSYYVRPWVDERRFSAARDEHITGDEARVVDAAIDMFDDTITRAVADARGDGLDWYLLDVAGILARLAARRYVDDLDARPAWWEPYPLPPALAALDPVPDTRFLTADGRGGRAGGGLFSLDGVHPTTVGYGILAQEIVNIMSRAGVGFRNPNGAPRSGRVEVDFARLLRQDTLIHTPPQNVDSALSVLGWVDEVLDLFRIEWRLGL
ncbi:hypothetical protein [Rhodococcus sp. B50]|uniref:hypothetical protein n=1 Tax=Rhodococcus sp. B50 TaxID=2682847 RepID=UPI001BD5D109|nr:hypothetical protein [Rhodococcus sp. B50]MBS9375333.1 hypothetical protein [Rhodococcus sp. B50]